MSKKNKGILLMTGSALAFAVMQVFVNLTGDIPTMEQMFFRNVIMLVLAGTMAVRQKISLFGELRYQPGLFARSIFGFFAVYCSFYGYSHATQGEVSILVKLAPFFIALFAWIFLKEKPEKSQFYALIFAFAGAVCVARPGFQSNVLPLAAAFMAAVLSGIAYTMLRYFEGRVDGLTVITHFSAVSIAGTIPFLLNSFVMPDRLQMLQLFLIGILSFFGQFCITYAYRMAPAAEISIYDYTGIIFSAVLGFVVLGEALPFLSLLGGALVITAALINYFGH